jgi:bifunctional non-homologous end joining protein LigD
VKQALEVEVEGKRLRLSNLDKLMYPAVGFTKGQVVDYYTRISRVLLPHLRGRPLTLKRYPDGVEGEHFYEKQCPSHRPPWVRTAAIRGERRGKVINYCVVDDLPTLVWTSNLADLELHTSLSLADDIKRPTMMVFDLDPGPPAGIIECVDVALILRGLLDELGLDSYAKTSGGKGFQLYVPLNTPVTYDDTKPFSHAMAKLMERRFPDRVVSVQKKELRKGKVLVDWSQNDEHKTTVCVYSLRARERPTVATPVTWEEAESALEAKDPEKLVFGPEDVLARVERDGDLFEPVVTLEQTLPSLPVASAHS